MYIGVLLICYLVQIKDEKSKDGDTAYVILSIHTILPPVCNDKLCRTLI